MFREVRAQVVGFLVAVVFLGMALAACRDEPGWNERPDKPMRTGRQDAPTPSPQQSCTLLPVFDGKRPTAIDVCDGDDK